MSTHLLLFSLSLNGQVGAAEMAQPLRALAPLPQDPKLVPSTHLEHSHLPVTPALKDPCPLLAAPGIHTQVWHMNIFFNSFFEPADVINNVCFKIANVCLEGQVPGAEEDGTCEVGGKYSMQGLASGWCSGASVPCACIDCN